MSLHDNLFSDDAEEDVRHFLRSDERKRVLIFPPVNNYRRFLIHQLVQERFGEQLHTFSIGQGLDRRTVVCYKSDFLGPVQVNGTSVPGGSNSNSNSPVCRASYTMGIESQCTPTTSPEHGAQRSRQVKSVPSVAIYVPPALRRARIEKSPAQSVPVEQTSAPDVSTRANRAKRPDRAVYVPRHRRSTSEVDSSNASAPEPKQSKPSKEPIRPMTRTVPINRESKLQVTSTDVTSVATTNDPVVEKTAEYEVTTTSDAVVDIELENNKPEDSALIHVGTISVENMESEEDDMADAPLNEEMKHQIFAKETQVMATSEVLEEKMETEVKQENENIALMSDDVVSSMVSEEPSEPTNSTYEQKSVQPSYGESDARDRRKATTPDIDVEKISGTQTVTPSESYKTSDSVELEQNSNAKLNVESKKTAPNKPMVDKVLVISTCTNKKPTMTKKKETEAPAVVPVTPPEKKVKKVERPKSKPAAPPAPPLKINRDECDWDSLFDDNGDCLDPTLIEELTSSVGEVVIEKPKSSYKSFTRPVEVSSDEFGHVLEIYNFPSEFKTSDLAAVFSPFKNGGFELKWVDDTHCLGVFSSPLVAAEVLASDHPFVKTRPLSEATALSKTKARKSSEFLQPYRTRPETCAALARRLVTKSLGVTLATARQEREQEKIVLREAKEKRRLANKQREEIWEGLVAPRTTS